MTGDFAAEMSIVSEGPRQGLPTPGRFAEQKAHYNVAHNLTVRLHGTGRAFEPLSTGSATFGCPVQDPANPVQRARGAPGGAPADPAVSRGKGQPDLEHGSDRNPQGPG